MTRPTLALIRLSIAPAWQLALGLTLAALTFPFDPLAHGLEAQEPGSILGQVTRNDQGPVAGTEVRIAPLGQVTRVGEEGHFEFRGLPAGRYVVTAESELAGAGRTEVTVTEGERSRLVIEVDPLFQLQEVLVSVGVEPVAEDDLYQAASMLSARELLAQLDASLGETLAGEPGVTSSYFGPGASRPIIRGLGGDRVRILESGIGTGDASTTSPDHAVTVEPQLARRIEIVRGPATLLYGSSAVGGVVNVIDGRIPEERTAGPVTGSLVANAGTVSDERNISGEVNGTIGRIGWHLGGLFRDTDDYEIPGLAQLPEDEPGELAGHEEEEEEVRGVLPNSAIETTRAAAGLSWIGADGFIGVSVSSFDTEYGIPPGAHGHGHGHDEAPDDGHDHAEESNSEEEGVTIDMRQRRLDNRGEWRLGTRLVEALKVRFGYTDYEHVEFEGDGIGTVFENTEWEARAEAATRFSERVHGAFGLQFGDRDFSALGEEAFTPPSETDQFGIFTLQELDLEALRLQLGFRYEFREVTVPELDASRDFDDLSVSGGLNWSATDASGLKLSVGRSVKFPSVEELFSDGPHLGTNSFDVGNPGLNSETTLHADLGLQIDHGRVRSEVTGYVNDFSDFIFQRFTGAEEDELPVLEWAQEDALFAGFESSLEIDLVELRGAGIALELTGDYVWAELSESNQPVPRIPPARLGGALLVRGSPWDGSLGLQRTTEQTRASEQEEPTEGYTMLNAQIGYRTMFGGVVHHFILQGRNLLDDEARNHAFFIKEFAPLPGRDIQLTYRLVF